MALKNRRFLALSDEILMSVEKPARYTGNEINMVKRPGIGRCPVLHVFPGCVRDWNVAFGNPDII